MKKFSAGFISLCICLTMLSGIYVNAEYSDPIVDKMTNTYSYALSLWQRENFYGYCGACVGYQLSALGINTQYVGLNGNQSYNYYASLDATSGGFATKKFPGSQFTLPMLINFLNTDSSSYGNFPTVLGFNKGTDSDAGQTYGHTMLIYEVSGGWVYYTDSILSDWRYNIHKQSINDFLWAYSDKTDTEKAEFAFDGAVQFYKQAPTAAKVTLSKNKVSLWEDIYFGISAPGGTNYILGIDRNGQRITTVNTNGSPYTSLQFGVAGIYTVYVTSCNLYGSVDSQRVTFEVYGAPENPYLTARNNPVASGSSIDIDFGASNSSIYCIGITKPDGSYTVEFTQYNNYSIPAYMSGTYTIFVTCCNVYGYIDTRPITVSVY